MKTRSLLLLLLALSACNKTREPDPPAEQTPAPKPQAEHPRKVTADHPRRDLSVKPNENTGPTDVAWEAPAAWPKSESNSPMRKATYKVPRVAPDTEDGELSVAQAGGTVDMNVKRWAGQFDAKPDTIKRDTREVNGLRVTVVEIHGAYTAMAMPGAPDAAKGPKPGFALLGAIVDTSPPTFFKLTGPEKSVVAARGDFDKLVQSLRAK